jgi:hypothetical protein
MMVVEGDICLELIIEYHDLALVKRRFHNHQNGIRNGFFIIGSIFYDILYDPSRWNGLSGGKRKM